ncbi:MAG: hypothetical protein HC876_17245 [Chloroflexaceae bacterium]|nr:hypothetical protein [Chloroflexaceae bacterium]
MTMHTIMRRVCSVVVVLLLAACGMLAPPTVRHPATHRRTRNQYGAAGANAGITAYHREPAYRRICQPADAAAHSNP